MTALATMGTSGTSPGLAYMLRWFEGPYRMTSVKVESPGDFTNLPPRFILVRKAGVYWLTDTAAPTGHGGRP